MRYKHCKDRMLHMHVLTNIVCALSQTNLIQKEIASHLQSVSPGPLHPCQRFLQRPAASSPTHTDAGCSGLTAHNKRHAWTARNLKLQWAAAPSAKPWLLSGAYTMKTITINQYHASAPKILAATMHCKFCCQWCNHMTRCALA